MRYPLLIPVLFAFHAIGCQAPAPGPGTQVPAQPAPATVDTKELDSQLLGDSLLRVLGPVQDLVVADLFAGKGYYTWKLLGAGARVLAIAQDQQDVAALEARKKQEGIGDDRLLIRLTTPGNPGLQPGEADIALVTREFSTLGDRKAWLGQLKAGLRPPYKFMLVNYMPGASPFGPRSRNGWTSIRWPMRSRQTASPTSPSSTSRCPTATSFTRWTRQRKKSSGQRIPCPAL